MTFASKERQLQRWAKLKEQPYISSLKCLLCEFENDIYKYDKLVANDIFNAGEIIRYKCPNCDLIFGDLRFLNLSELEICEDYEDLYSYYTEGDTSRFIIECLENTNFYNNKEKTYLDYACGDGQTLSVLKKKDIIL